MVTAVFLRGCACWLILYVGWFTCLALVVVLSSVAMFSSHFALSRGWVISLFAYARFASRCFICWLVCIAI